MVADIAEEWVTPLDTRMDRIGGVVFRRARTLVKNLQADRTDIVQRLLSELKKQVADGRGTPGSLQKNDVPVNPNPNVEIPSGTSE